MICFRMKSALRIIFLVETSFEAELSACEAGVDIIISGAGLPMKLPEYTKDFPNVALVPIVSFQFTAWKWNGPPPEPCPP